MLYVDWELEGQKKLVRVGLQEPFLGSIRSWEGGLTWKRHVPENGGSESPHHGEETPLLYGATYGLAQLSVRQARRLHLRPDHLQRVNDRYRADWNNVKKKWKNLDIFQILHDMIRNFFDVIIFPIMRYWYCVWYRVSVFIPMNPIMILCIHSDLCTVKLSIQRYTPCITLAHVGLKSLQSKYY